MPTTFFMLAGEASGDSHAAKLITALKALEADVRFIGMGGPKMAAAGLDVAKDLDGMQVVGFWEVARRYGFFKRVFQELLDRVKQERPSALICVDYPGFNLRFAKEVRRLGIPVLYYIVPQVWAWKAMRAKSMARYVDRAFCVFEFEPPFFEKFGLKTQFVGHPLIDDCGLRIADCGLKLPPGPKTVAFLPGSREPELAAHMPQFYGAMKTCKANNYRFMVSFPSGITTAYYRMYKSLLAEESPPYDPIGVPGTPTDETDFAPLEQNAIAVGFKVHAPLSEAACSAGAHLSHARLLPAAADFSVVKSGTSTLEAGLAGNPMCVVYKSSFLSYAIAHLVVNIPVFSLVNIVLGRYAVPELLQGEVNPSRIAQELERGLTDEKYREQQKAALAELPKKLGGPGASARAAKGIMDFLKGSG